MAVNDSWWRVRLMKCKQYIVCYSIMKDFLNVIVLIMPALHYSMLIWSE